MVVLGGDGGSLGISEAEAKGAVKISNAQDSCWHELIQPEMPVVLSLETT